MGVAVQTIQWEDFGLGSYIPKVIRQRQRALKQHHNSFSSLLVHRLNLSKLINCYKKAGLFISNAINNQFNKRYALY